MEEQKEIVKRIIELHKGENVEEFNAKATEEEIEKIVTEHSNNCDRVLVYSPSEAIIYGYEKGKKVNFTTDYVTE